MALKDKSWTAALEQAAGYEGLPAAVILDLDETVLDNSPSQGQLVLDRADFTTKSWDAWVEKVSAAEIPGAGDFLALAQRRDVRVFFVTNRTAAQQAATLKNLAGARDHRVGRYGPVRGRERLDVRQNRPPGFCRQVGTAC